MELHDGVVWVHGMKNLLKATIRDGVYCKNEAMGCSFQKFNCVFKCRLLFPCFAWIDTGHVLGNFAVPVIIRFELLQVDVAASGVLDALVKDKVLVHSALHVPLPLIECERAFVL